MASNLHCVYCFDVLLSSEGGHTTAPHEFKDHNESAASVTWLEQDTVRGAQISLEPKQLSAQLKELALASAKEDNRSAPIKTREIQWLTCVVTLIDTKSIRLCDNLDDWQIGKHGIQVQFDDPADAKKTYLKALLPETVVKRGLSKEQAIEECVKKSGYTGALTAQLRSRIVLRRFEVLAEARLNYDEYKAHFREEMATAKGTPKQLEPQDPLIVRLRRRARYFDAPHEAHVRKVKQQKGNRLFFWMVGLIVLALVGVGLLKYFSETYDVDFDRYMENYAFLGLPAEAPFPDVKKAFHELSRKWHPDRCPVEEKADCNEKYIKILNSYNQIVDVERGVAKLINRPSPAEPKRGAKPPRSNPFF